MDALKQLKLAKNGYIIMSVLFMVLGACLIICGIRNQVSIQRRNIIVKSYHIVQFAAVVEVALWQRMWRT